MQLFDALTLQLSFICVHYVANTAVLFLHLYTPNHLLRGGGGKGSLKARNKKQFSPRTENKKYNFLRSENVKLAVNAVQQLQGLTAVLQPQYTVQRIRGWRMKYRK